MKKIKPAFTLIELLVVIAIIGILSTLAVVSLTNARQSARDTKRLADVKQIQTALELYYNDTGSYPSSITDSIATSGITYMQTYPTAPTPADGDCSDSDNAYNYTVSGTENSSYSLTFCLGSQVNNLDAGIKEAIPGGIIAASSPTPWACGDDIIDSRDNKSYTTILIGTQCWMKENLAYLPVVHSNSQFATQGNGSLPGYGVYSYDGSDVSTAKATSNYSTYGVLYNWHALDQVNLCPTGWYVPSDAEWTTLITYLGGESVAGGEMKKTGELDFTALPAGLRNIYGDFDYILSNVNFWSSSEYNSSDSWSIFLSSKDSQAQHFYDGKTNGFSVRCLLD